MHTFIKKIKSDSLWAKLGERRGYNIGTTGVNRIRSEQTGVYGHPI